MSSIVLLGAKSFIGEAIISHIDLYSSIKAVSYKSLPSNFDHHKNIAWYQADLLVPNSLDSILTEGDLVINLAYIHNGSFKDNFLLLNNIINSCHQSGVRRLIHCSSIDVFGRTKDNFINEKTPCMPLSDYERIKFDLEGILKKNVLNTLDYGILRPTQVVGPGGRALTKLAWALKNSSWISNYLRASLYGMRPMHLVPVRNVAKALVHLATLSNNLNGNVYIVSSDEEECNTFNRVEKCLILALGLKKRKFPLIPFPEAILSLILRLRGRSNFNIKKKYDSSKLMLTGFSKIDSVKDAIRAYANSIK